MANDGATDRPVPGGWRRISPVAWAAVLEALLLVGLAVFVLKNYFIKAYSDPINYLETARRVFEEFRTSRWPIGYTFLLWLALRAIGPYYIFLVNLPLLLLLISLVARVTRRAAEETESAAQAALLGVSAAALALVYDPHMFVYLANPYRDPLALVLNALAVLCLLRYVRDPRHPPWLIGLTGLAAGLSYTVREPCILITVPLAAFGLHAARKNRGISVWASAVLFVVFLLLGAAPFLVQTYLRTRQILIPGEAAVAGRLPGLYWHTIQGTFPLWLLDLRTRAGWPGIAFLLAGIGWSVRRRNAPLLFLILPAALVFMLFYSFYWAYVRRYFFAVILFSAPLAALGLFKSLEALLRLFRRPGWASPARAVLAVGLGLVAGWKMFNPAPPGSRFRIADARTLTADLERVVPRGSTVLAPRYLCEVMSWFLEYSSYPLQALSIDEVPVDHRLAAGLNGLLASNPAVYLAEVFNAKGQTDGGGVLARQFLNTEPFATFTNAKYNLAAICSDQKGFFVLHRLKPWTAGALAQELEPPPAPEAILQVDARMLWHNSSSRAQARLRLNGVMLADPLRNGLNYFRCPTGLQPPFILRLESDQPLPDRLDTAWRLPNAALDYALKPGTYPSSTSLLGEGDWAFQEYWHEWYGFTHEARIDVPVTWAGEEDYLLEFRLRAPVKDAAPLHIRMSSEAGEPLAEAQIPADTAFSSLTIRSRKPPDATAQTFRLQELSGRDAVVEIGRVSAHPLAAAHPVLVAFGTHGDEPFIVSGVYSRELDKGNPFRWSMGETTLNVYAPTGSNDLRLRLVLSDHLRPAKASPAEPRLSWNGTPLETLSSAGETPGEQVLEARVEASRVRQPVNLLSLTCTPWTARDYDQRDPRTFGVVLRRLEWTPATP